MNHWDIVIDTDFRQVFSPIPVDPKHFFRLRFRLIDIGIGCRVNDKIRLNLLKDFINLIEIRDIEFIFGYRNRFE